MQWAMQRYSGDKGYTPEQFYAVMSEAAGVDLKDWFAKTAESTEELDYTEALDYYGLRFRPVDTRKAARPCIGGGTRNDGGRLVVTSVRRGTPASTPASTWTTRSSRSTMCGCGRTGWRRGWSSTGPATRWCCWSRGAIG